MAGRSRSENGVASLAYVPAIPIKWAPLCQVNRDARDKPGHDGAQVDLKADVAHAVATCPTSQPLSFLSEGTHSIAGVVIAMPISPNWLVIWAFLLTGFTPSSW